MSVPKLRFKENDGGKNTNWKEENLLNLSESGFSNGVFNDPAKVGSGYKLINVLDMYIESTIDENKLTLIEIDESEFNKNKANYGDIFFTRSSLVKEGIAHSNVFLSHSQDVTFDGHLIRMSPKKDLLNPMFFYYVLKTSKVRKQLVKRGKTTTMTTIGQADIATVNVAFPSISEQSKIADFLMTIDEKIAQLTQKCELLSRYKKGVMQQLFSQKLRFKDDDRRDFPDWEEKKVGSICDSIVPGRNKPVDFDGDIPWITTPDIEQNGIIYDSKKGLRITKEEAKKVGSKIVPKDSVVISCVGDLGLVAISGKEIIINQQLHAFIPKKDIYYKFLVYSLSTKKEYMEKVATKTAVPYMNKENCNSIPINYPSLPEQTKIANFLTAIDEKMTQTKTYLETVKKYKQGLLQQMFL